jgi:hypothetical protein
MGQEEVDRWWRELKQGLVGLNGVVSEIDGAQQPGKQVPVLRPTNELQFFRYAVKGSVAVPKRPVAVVGFEATVEADANSDVFTIEQPEDLFVDQQPIGLNSDSER